ncbi:MAG: hypothetical protein ACK571_14195 [Pseudanabaena sp.]
MNELRYTLLTDGSSDRALARILDWLLRIYLPHMPIQSQWANLGRLPKPPKTLSDRIVAALDLYPCDLLFIHRDAEREPINARIEEINSAMVIVQSKIIDSIKTVPVIPIRMTEAWLLIDEKAIKTAAGNPRGKQILSMPAINRLETIPDPKALLQELLKTATNLPKRRQEIIPIQRVVDNIDNFSPLQNLTAFQTLETELRSAISLLFPQT